MPLEDGVQLVHLYAERGSPKYGKAALRWLERYITEGSPRLSTSRRSRRIWRDVRRRCSGPCGHSSWSLSACTLGDDLSSLLDAENVSVDDKVVVRG